jgi:cell division inhibitor SepF
MALSEGFKGFVNFITNSFKDDGDEPFRFPENDTIDWETDGALARDKDIEEFYPRVTKPERSFTKTTDKVTSIHSNSYKSGEVTVIEPRAFSESTQIVRKLLENKTVILHLDLLDKEQSQRTIDFVCGAAHALNGMAQKISDMVFIFTPSNVSLSVENGAAQSKFSESLWNKPL